MKPSLRPFAIKMVFGFSLIFLLFSFNAFGSTISGIIYDKQRNVVPDVDVELLDDLYRSYRRTKTDSMGKYQFDGLSDGYWTVKVMPFRYDLLDQQQTIEIATMKVRGQGQGNAFMLADFYLLPRKGGLKDTELSVVFAQEIPKTAQAAYDQAIEDFSKKRAEEGFNNLKKALEIMPTYYAALYRYGNELYNRKQYKDAAAVFMEAVKVNEKSATSFYYLGASFHKLGKDYHKAAHRAMNFAYTLAPASVQVLWYLGKIERDLGKFQDAEKHLLQAKKVATGKIPDVHWELALLYGNNLKKYKEAADELELYLKATKLENKDEETTKKLIADFREKAKTQTN